MIGRILQNEYDVPLERSADCAKMVSENGRFANLLRDIGGSPHVLFDTEINSLPTPPTGEGNGDDAELETTAPASKPDAIGTPTPPVPPLATGIGEPSKPKPIFVGHGKNVVPLQKLQTLLSTFQIPHKVTVGEANLGRPIPQKVKDTMELCGSAILIFTRDEKFIDKNGDEIWRPSENVVYELGASSFAYGDRIVVFKERGLTFPTNFQSIGHIEFEVDTIEAKTADLLKELIGFGLVKVSPV